MILFASDEGLIFAGAVVLVLVVAVTIYRLGEKEDEYEKRKH